MSELKNKKKGNTPSKEDAAAAMEFIKVLQEKGDVESARKKEKEELEAKEKMFQEAEKMRVAIAHEQVRKKLKENLRKKEKQKNKKTIIDFLESATIKDSKIKWKSVSNGYKLHGYVENKLVFEIVRGLTLFSLYIKDNKIKSEKKLPSYIGCSTSLIKLKHKSDKII